MGQIAYRANLSSATYPMTIADGGRTVIIPGPDNNYDRRVDPTGQQLDAGIPQALYLENVMPTVNGYQSVGYKTLAALPAPGPTAGGVGAIVVYGHLYLYVESGGVPGLFNRFLCLFRGRASLSNRDVVISSFNAGTFAWTYGTGAIPYPLQQSLSTARVRTTTYVFDGTLLYEVDNPSADVLNFTDVSGTVTGLTLTDVVCIWSCANYLLAVLKDGTVQWSSTTTPTDFTSSLVSGAGNITPNDVKLNVKFVKEAINAFYMYSESGVVLGQYTGNARYPFKFSAVQDSGSYELSSQAFGDNRSDTQYALDIIGNIRSIRSNETALIAAELSQLMGKMSKVDELNLTSNVFSLVTKESLNFNYSNFISRNKITYLLDRYVAVSYLANGINYFVLFDLATNRYGKLKVAGDVYTDLKDLYFFGVNQGDVGYQMSFDIYNTDYTFSCALVLGKFQYVRSRMMQMEEIEIEGPQNTAIIPSPNFSAVLLPSTDGRNFDTPVPLTSSYLSGGVAKYYTHQTAQNHSLLLKGAFSVNTVQLRFVPGGER